MYTPGCRPCGRWRGTKRRPSYERRGPSRCHHQEQLETPAFHLMQTQPQVSKGKWLDRKDSWGPFHVSSPEHHTKGVCLAEITQNHRYCEIGWGIPTGTSVASHTATWTVFTGWGWGSACSLTMRNREMISTIDMNVIATASVAFVATPKKPPMCRGARGNCPVCTALGYTSLCQIYWIEKTHDLLKNHVSA